jgi:hypothetical protein
VRILMVCSCSLTRKAGANIVIRPAEAGHYGNGCT